MADNILLEAALRYAALGWRVIPLHTPTPDGGCSCRNSKCKDQGKHPRLKAWQEQATTDPAVIQSWWRKWPDANVGIVTGEASGIVVLDVDSLKGGDESLLALVAEHGPLPETVESLTGGGGRHLIFKYPGAGILKNWASILGPGLDIRADNGQIVAPPSLHKSGNRYEWEASSEPGIVEVADFPEWLIPKTDFSKNGHSSGRPKKVPEKIPAGARNQTLISLAGAMRRRGMTGEEIEAALLVVNQNRCDPPLEPEEVSKIAYSAARYKIERKVPTDDELADRWLDKHPDTAYGLGEFRRYQDGYWPALPYSQVEAEVLEIVEQAKAEDYKPSSWKVKSVIDLARIKCQVPDEKWNSDTDIIVCKNGTLHIPTGQLRAHSQEDYATGTLPFEYDPYQAAPTWTLYLSQVVSDDVRLFLQEYAGYCLTTDTSFELAVWLYGPPGGGKSTFIQGVQTILGERAGVLGLSDIERSHFALSDLPSKTLLVSAEQPSSFITTTNIINALISGEPILVDRKYKTPITVTPRAKLLWAMNETPRVADANNGLFRRVRVVRFATPIPNPDPNLKDAIAHEGTGILNWALEGLFRLRARGRFDLPPEVNEWSEQFKASNDIPAAFLDDKYERRPKGADPELYRVEASKLYDDYKNWCYENGHRPQSSTGLRADWERLGLVYVKRKEGRYWYGVRPIRTF